MLFDWEDGVVSVALLMLFWYKSVLNYDVEK